MEDSRVDCPPTPSLPLTTQFFLSSPPLAAWRSSACWGTSPPYHDPLPLMCHCLSFFLSPTLQIISLLGEYYNSGDLNEAAVRLTELDHPLYGHYFVKVGGRQGG